MNKRLLVFLSIVALVSILVVTSVVNAAKPQTSIQMSNGLPSGEHEILLIHGKNASFTGEESSGGNVVNVPEYTSGGTDTINYVSGRKVKIDHLTVFDSNTESFDDGDPAEVWLPYEQEGYYVFARALGKPAKGYGDEGYSPRNIIIENTDLKAYTPIIGDITEPGDIPVDLPLGLITNGTYKAVSTTEAGVELIRFDSEPEGNGRGKTLGKDITDMFLWSGYVFQPILDLNGDGLVNEADVPSIYDTNGTPGIQEDEFQNWLNDNQYGYVFPLDLDTNGDGLVNEADVPSIYDTNGTPGIQEDELLDWVGDMTGTDPNNYYVDLWEYYPPEDPIWIFNIADLVYQYQVVTNNGIKNLQIRFYPVATTDFLRNSIVVDKETIPSGSTQSFGFTLSDEDGVIIDEFSLTDGAIPYTSTYLPTGTYYIQENVPTGWNVTGIEPNDGNSDGDLNTAIATIRLEENERVTVTFTNTQA